jgi:hypothetical protein
MKTKQKKKATKPVRKGKPAPSRRTFPGSDYPFYALNEQTASLSALAHYARGVEEIERLWKENMSDLDVAPHDSLAFLKYSEKFDWMKESRLLRVLAENIVKRDDRAVQSFAEAYHVYDEGGRNLGNKDMAKVCLMIACISSWHEKSERSALEKATLEKRAREIWARFYCRGKHKNPTKENLDHEERHLPIVDWTLVRREIALDDIRDSKPGRKSKTANW